MDSEAGASGHVQSHEAAAPPDSPWLRPELPAPRRLGSFLGTQAGRLGQFLVIRSKTSFAMGLSLSQQAWGSGVSCRQRALRPGLRLGPEHGLLPAHCLGEPTPGW